MSPHRSSSGVATFQAGLKDLAAGAGVASPAAEGMGNILGQCSYQLVACVVSGLPWVLAHRHEPESRSQVCHSAIFVMDGLRHAQHAAVRSDVDSICGSILCM